MKFKMKIATLALLIAASLTVQAEDIAVIVNPAYAGGLDRQQIEQIYLGRSQQLTPYDLPDASPVKERFYQRLTGRNLAQVKSVWSRLVFSGRARLPDELINSKAVKRTVASDEGAIGYVAESVVDETVKVLLTLSD